LLLSTLRSAFKFYSQNINFSPLPHLTCPANLPVLDLIAGITDGQYKVWISLMMETERTSETLVDNYFTRQYIPEDNAELHTRRRENLKHHKYESHYQMLFILPLIPPTRAIYFPQTFFYIANNDSCTSKYGNTYTVMILIQVVAIQYYLRYIADIISILIHIAYNLIFPLPELIYEIGIVCIYIYMYVR
jgi:hypothetical protein